MTIITSTNNDTIDDNNDNNDNDNDNNNIVKVTR